MPLMPLMPLMTMVALALLSACSGTDCGPRTELQAGEPCGSRLFTYCPATMVCCLSGSSPAPACAMASQCRNALQGEVCADNPWSGAPFCESLLVCRDGRCVCDPYRWCWDNALCWRDERACLFSCCSPSLRCVNGWCVERPPDSGPTTGRDAESDVLRDAAVETRGDAGRDLRGAEPGGDLHAGAEGGPP